MHKTLQKIFSMLFALSVFISCSTDVIVVYDISGDRFTRLVEKQWQNFSKFLILDVRTEEEYLEGHFYDALNYPVSDVEKRYKEIEDYKTLPIYIYGRTADQSFKAAKVLAENGFTQIYNCEGTEETEYTFYTYNPIRLKAGFALAHERGFQLVDYRTQAGRTTCPVPEANFITFPNLDEIINAIDYSEGYIIFSTNITHARDCAREFTEYGFKNVYYCIDNILEYPEYFSTENTDNSN